MNDKVKDFLKKVDFEELAKKISEDYENRLHALHDFYNRPRFKEILNLIKLEIEKKEQLIDDAYSDFVFENVSNDEFINVFDVIFAHQITGNIVKSFNHDFECDYVFYNDLYFIQMHGQGTAYIVRKKLWD